MLFDIFNFASITYIENTRQKTADVDCPAISISETFKENFPQISPEGAARILWILPTTLSTFRHSDKRTRSRDLAEQLHLPLVLSASSEDESPPGSYIF